VRLEREQQRTSVLLAQLERLSHEDPLTGLANRRRWDAELGSVCAAARQSGSVVAVVLLDIDHFKEINDRHGHPGGDEFAVLLPDADLDRAIELAERLRAEAGGSRAGRFRVGRGQSLARGRLGRGAGRLSAGAHVPG
jgi:GGDEF domain-containing protein